MSKEFNDYKRTAVSFYGPGADPVTEWKRLYDWYRDDGRQEFASAFTKETGLGIGQHKPDALVAAGIPKSYRDFERKLAGKAFYRANAAWFLEEMDTVVGAVPRNASSPVEARHLADVGRFVHKVLLDSIVLFDDWGTYFSGVPGTYGIGKNTAEHIMDFYQGARQTIYGHGSWGLSFVDNHSDLSAATIRQAIEIRLRRAFGVMGKFRKSDGSVHPIHLSDLLDAIDAHKDNVRLPVRLENIARINGWTNMYLHTGLKLYAWCPPRILAFLREFLLGGKGPGYTHHSSAGITVDRPTFDGIREILRQRHEDSDFELSLPDASQCAVTLV